MPTIEDVTLPEGSLKRIHIHTAKIRRFHKTGADEPAVIVRTSQGIYHGRDVEIHGSAKVIQSLSKPMPGCGARIWIETRAAVAIQQAQPVVEESCPIAAVAPAA